MIYRIVYLFIYFFLNVGMASHLHLLVHVFDVSSLKHFSQTDFLSKMKRPIGCVAVLPLPGCYSNFTTMVTIDIRQYLFIKLLTVTRVSCYNTIFIVWKKGGPLKIKLCDRDGS